MRHPCTTCGGVYQCVPGCPEGRGPEPEPEEEPDGDEHEPDERDFQLYP